jgi:hypothetical protein|tara:strand:+ start:1620 stop:1820 length:201 start_codon:yes stop_codon:yes gene_type:complete
MKPLIKKVLREYWEKEPDKWDLVAEDLKECLENIIQKHKSNFYDDQYAVISAIEDIMENMFAKVPR